MPHRSDVNVPARDPAPPASNRSFAGRPLVSRVASAGLALTFFAAGALAQTDLNPPENESGIEGKPWTSSAVALLAVGVVLAGAFLKSKRGHQD